LAKSKQKQVKRQAGERFDPLHLEPAQEIYQENRSKHGHCDQEAKQQFLAAAGIL
jgi:hypothetical protein